MLASSKEVCLVNKIAPFSFLTIFKCSLKSSSGNLEPVNCVDTSVIMPYLYVVQNSGIVIRKIPKESILDTLLKESTRENGEYKKTHFPFTITLLNLNVSNIGSSVHYSYHSFEILNTT